MRTVAYFISDYGFGHAARSIAIIRTMLHVDPHVKVMVCCSFALDFIKKSLQDEDQKRLYYHQVMNDFGFMLKKNSIEVDVLRMNKEYETFIHYASGYAQDQMRFLQQFKVDLVISDISPLPFIAAKELGIPTIGISNFTWYTAYLDILPKEKLQFLYQAYKHMDHFIPLAGANEPLWNGSLDRSYDYFCREINHNEVESIRSKLNPDKDRFIVYFGLGMKIGVDNLSKLKIWDSKQCVFLVSGNAFIEGDNIIRIPKDITETQNYIAACDLVISKPGWGTVSEAIQSRKPLLILERGYMREDQNTIESLLSHDLCQCMTWSDFQTFEITESIKRELKSKSHQQTVVKNNQVLKEISDKILYNVYAAIDQ